MASTGPAIDPLTSQDGSPVTVVTQRGEGAVKTYDETMLEMLAAINDRLGAIVAMLEYEFEMQGENLDGED